ncbi:MAG: TIGR04283 family arsenosugar biosynthesis glycosyltransferase [Pyrinomonadaceae bacterium]|nr:TIGR04283 family arsenosugar biosynthesis glycosyltransferase [Pyrinomonadaceae bacterium]
MDQPKRLPGEETFPAFSVIIPTFNEADSISRTLDAVKKLRGRIEVIVVDGGSSDGTEELGRARGMTLIASERGRGAQMHAGACAARGEVLWFLHADTLPPNDALEQITHSLSDSRVVGGSFNVDFDSRRLSARFLTRFYRELRRFGLSYGDSAIFVRREVYERVGGFKPFPIFEDLDLMQRLCKHGGMAQLRARVVTSSRRFEGRSFALTFAKWTFLQILYWIGVNPQALGGFYAPIRDPKLSQEIS